MSDDELIRRGDALAAIQLGDTVTKLQARIRAIPAIDADPVCTDCGGTGITYQTERRCACQQAPDPAAIREAAESSPNRAYRVGYAAGRAAGLREAAEIIGGMVEGALTVQAQEHAIQCQEAVLAPITKGGDNRQVYMGQIMAECDCPREAECQAAGRCIAEGRR